MRAALPIVTGALAVTCLGACGSGTSSGAPESTPTPGKQGPHDDCTPDVQSAMEATIGDQQEALARGDYVAAWQFASSGFRSGVDAEGLQAIIERGYRPLADATELEFTACAVIAPGSAAIAVDTVGEQSARYLYVLVLEGDRWFIDRVSGLAGAPALQA